MVLVSQTVNLSAASGCRWRHESVYSDIMPGTSRWVDVWWPAASGALQQERLTNHALMQGAQAKLGHGLHAVPSARGCRRRRPGLSCGAQVETGHALSDSVSRRRHHNVHPFELGVGRCVCGGGACTRRLAGAASTLKKVETRSAHPNGHSIPVAPQPLTPNRRDDVSAIPLLHRRRPRVHVPLGRPHI